MDETSTPTADPPVTQDRQTTSAEGRDDSKAVDALERAAEEAPGPTDGADDTPPDASDR